MMSIILLQAAFSAFICIVDNCFLWTLEMHYAKYMRAESVKYLWGIALHLLVQRTH